MRKLLAAASVVALLGISAPALAEELTGTIAGMDESRILLNDGSLFILGDGVSIDDLEVGSLVVVVFEETESGQKIAREVKTVR